MSMLEEKDYDNETGLPLDESYLECGLPPYVQDSIEAMGMVFARKIFKNGNKISIIYNDALYMLKFPSLPTKTDNLSYKTVADRNILAARYLKC